MRRISGVMAALALITIVFAPAPAQAQPSYTYSYSGPPLPIFRDSANIITVATLYIPRAIMLNKITVNVDIDYPRPGDLNVFMYSPILTRTKLLERNCGSQGTLQNITFDDSAASTYSTVCPAASGSYKGNEPLGNFNGQNSLGLWSIAVENNGSDDFIGYLRGYSITFSGAAEATKPYTAPQAVFNAAGFQSAVVAPGEMINIAGFNLGPGTAVTAPAGDLPTALGGVQVTFDGTPAAMSYASANLLTAQVPFGLQPGVQTSMKVTYSNTVSDLVPLDVASSVPGVYTQSADGRGVVSAVNSDGTLNSKANPAAKGSYVSVYATGLGAVSPALATGQVPPISPLSPTVAPVSALIAGYPATMNFAGAAPTLPAVYQINMVVPVLAGSGAQPLSISVAGGASSQNFVVIFVR